MQLIETSVPATEIRLVSYDLNHHGKPDTVMIEFYKQGELEYAIEAVEKTDTGFTKIVSNEMSGIDNEVLLRLANLVLHFH